MINQLLLERVTLRVHLYRYTNSLKVGQASIWPIPRAKTLREATCIQSHRFQGRSSSLSLLHYTRHATLDLLIALLHRPRLARQLGARAGAFAPCHPTGRL